jgi:hypothetical protein
MTPEEQLAEQAKLLLAFDGWALKGKFLAWLKNEADWFQSSFDVALSDPQYAASPSHGAALIDGKKSLIHTIESEVEKAKQWIQTQAQPRKQRRPRRRPQA